MCSYMYTMVDDNNTIEDKVCKMYEWEKILAY